MKDLAFSAQQTLWISHRGESLDAPENTIPAFALSLERNSDGMECDIHFTADRHVVCSHDYSTGRVGNMDLVVAETTFADLQKVDVSNQKDNYTDSRIPLFTDTLQYLGKNRQFYVEIKPDIPGLVPELHRILDASGIPLEQFTIISFDIEAVRESKKLRPDITALLLVGGKPLPALDDIMNRLSYCNADGLDVFFGEEVDENFVKTVKDAGYFLAVWTVDLPEKAQRCLELGIDAVTSNCAAKLKKYFIGE